MPTATLLAALCVLCCTFGASSSQVDASSIPIGKASQLALTRGDGTVIFDNLQRSVSFTKRKYESTRLAFQRSHGYPIPGTPELEQSRGTKRDSSIPLSPESGSAFWAGNITVGGQQFRIDFDTGSADLWIPSINCTTSACQTKARFDDTLSGKTVNYPDRQFSISYVDGSGVAGGVFSDTIYLGNIGASGGMFSAVTKLDTTLNDDPVDGIMGMAYSSISNLGQTAFNNMWKKRGASVVGKNMFSFFLSDNVAGGSQLYLGGYDTSKFSGNIYYNKVVNKGYWQIGNGSASANGKTTTATKFNAIIDTGTTLIYAPNSTVAKIFRNVPGAKYWRDSYWTFPCATPPTIAFKFNSGPSFSIPSSQMNLGRTSATSTQCVAGIIAESFAGSSILMGDLFLKNVYTVFSFADNAVGFASLGGPSRSGGVLALSRNPMPGSGVLAQSRGKAKRAIVGQDNEVLLQARALDVSVAEGLHRHRQARSGMHI